MLRHPTCIYVRLIGPGLTHAYTTHNTHASIPVTKRRAHEHYAYARRNNTSKHTVTRASDKILEHTLNTQEARMLAQGKLFFGSRQLKIAKMDGRAGAKKNVKP